MASIAELPNELLLTILSEHVPLQDLAACTQVCRRWRGLFRCKALRHYHNARFAYNLSTFHTSDAEVLSYADLDFAGRRGNTPLHAAAAAGDGAGVEILLRRIEAEIRPEDRLKGYIDLPNNEGATPFLLAVSAGNVCVAKRLADLGSDLAAAVRCSRHWSPIHFAVAHESVEFVKLLLSYGASANTADRFGATPLHVAAEASRSGRAGAMPDGSLEIARILLENGADPLSTDFFSQTPLHIAALGRADIFGVILDRSLSLLSRRKKPTPRPSHSGSGYRPPVGGDRSPPSRPMTATSLVCSAVGRAVEGGRAPPPGSGDRGSAEPPLSSSTSAAAEVAGPLRRSEERRVGKECRN